jgi:hypothetical protein
MLENSDSNRVRVYNVYIHNDNRIPGVGWTNRSSRPLLHDVGHWRFRLQLYWL